MFFVFGIAATLLSIGGYASGLWPIKPALLVAIPGVIVMVASMVL